MRYSAFVSYNHRDKAWARWLHQSLEKYLIPKHLRGKEAPFGTIGSRLPPVFRDREELASSSDLAAAVKAALAEASTLIVVCSPNSAQSKWVDEEVMTFIDSGRRDRILCVIVAGEPGSADLESECLPPALRTGSEPLAADARKDGDGKALARLKLLAGILDVPFDELRQREAHRRHRRLAWLAGASTAGLVLTSGLAVFAFVSRAQAIEQRRVAEERRVTAERTVDFVKSMFKSSDPSEARGETMTAREVVDRGARQLDAGLEDQPTVKAELGATLAEVYAALGLYHRSEEVIDQSLKIRQPQAVTTARQFAALGETKFQLGDYRGALEAFRRASAIAPREGEEEALASRILVGLGQTQSALGNEATSEGALQRALQIDRQRGLAGQSDVARDVEASAVNKFFLGDLDTSAKLTAEALAMRLRLEGPASPSVADDRNLLASIAHQRGQLSLAEALYRENLSWDEKVLGKEHPDLAITLNNLARVLVEQRNFRDAGVLLERAIDITRRQRGDAYDDLAYMLGSMAIVRRSQGRASESEDLLREAIAIGRKQHHASLAPNMVELASLLCDRRRFAEATDLLVNAGPIMKADYPDDAWRSAWLRLTQAQCLFDQGGKSAAREIVASDLPTISARWPAGSYYREQAESLRKSLGA
ncbi:MAG TPA: toll/interleukin-1 receptor domain-containing protein [Croceibacterium sp.]|jgi:tetratricopeptide (TPR) repeat protein